MTRTAELRGAETAAPQRNDAMSDEEFAQAVSDGLDAAIAELEESLERGMASLAFDAGLVPLGLKPDLMMLYLGMLLWRTEKHDQELFHHVRRWYLDVSGRRLGGLTATMPTRRRRK